MRPSQLRLRAIFIIRLFVKCASQAISHTYYIAAVAAWDAVKTSLDFLGERTRTNERQERWRRSDLKVPLVAEVRRKISVVTHNFVVLSGTTLFKVGNIVQIEYVLQVEL